MTPFAVLASLADLVNLSVCICGKFSSFACSRCSKEMEGQGRSAPRQPFVLFVSSVVNSYLSGLILAFARMTEDRLYPIKSCKRCPWTSVSRRSMPLCRKVSFL